MEQALTDMATTLARREAEMDAEAAAPWFLVARPSGPAMMAPESQACLRPASSSSAPRSCSADRCD